MRISRVDDGWAFIHHVRDAEGESLRVLRVGGVYQSATYLGNRWHELPFEYFRAFDRMFDAEDASGFKIRRVLMIGGGGCSYPKHLLMCHDDVSMDVVERDARVVRLARKHFFVDKIEREAGADGRFRLIVKDGRSYLERCDLRYEVIVNDAFAGADPVRSLMDDGGLEAVHRCLEPGGLYMINLVVGQSAQDFASLLDVLMRLEGTFGHAYVIPATDDHFGGKDNYISVAADRELEIRGALEFDSTTL